MTLNSSHQIKMFFVVLDAHVQEIIIITYRENPHFFL